MEDKDNINPRESYGCGCLLGFIVGILFAIFIL